MKKSNEKIKSIIRNGVNKIIIDLIDSNENFNVNELVNLQVPLFIEIEKVLCDNCSNIENKEAEKEEDNYNFNNNIGSVNIAKDNSTINSTMTTYTETTNINKKIKNNY